MRFFLCLLLLSPCAFADEPTPDCRYSGSGTFFVFEVSSNKWVPNLAQSYLTTAQRFPQGGGKYLIVQTKTFNDGRPPQRITYNRDRYVGPVELSKPDGSVINRGYCSRVGHCFGETKGTAVPTESRWTLDYDANSVRLVNAAVNGAFILDEVLHAEAPCEFAP